MMQHFEHDSAAFPPQIISQHGQHNQTIGSPVVYYIQFLDSHNLHLEVVQIFINQCKLYPGYLFKP